MAGADPSSTSPLAVDSADAVNNNRIRQKKLTHSPKPATPVDMPEEDCADMPHNDTANQVQETGPQTGAQPNFDHVSKDTITESRHHAASPVLYASNVVTVSVTNGHNSTDPVAPVPTTDLSIPATSIQLSPILDQPVIAPNNFSSVLPLVQHTTQLSSPRLNAMTP